MAASFTSVLAGNSSEGQSSGTVHFAPKLSIKLD
jgi:hypothetical protein